MGLKLKESPSSSFLQFSIAVRSCYAVMIKEAINYLLRVSSAHSLRPPQLFSHFAQSSLLLHLHIIQWRKSLHPSPTASLSHDRRRSAIART